MATVIRPSDHWVTIEFEGKEINTNIVQLMYARQMIKLHLVGIKNKVSPVKFLNNLFRTRRTAKFWKKFLDQVLG